MKRKFNRTLSRVLASVMVMSSLTANMVYADTTYADISTDDAVVSGAALDEEAEVSETTVSDSSDGEIVFYEELTAAEKGKTYSVDFRAEKGEESIPLDGKVFAGGTIRATSPQGDIRTDNHGTTNKPGDKFEISVAGDATIWLTPCNYGDKTGNWVLTDASGAQIGSIPAYSTDADGSEKPVKIDYEGAAGTLTLTFDGSGQTYVHEIKVVNAAEAVGEAVSFTEWFDDLAKDGSIAQQSFSYGGSTLEFVGEGDTPFTVLSNAANLTRDGKTVNGYKAGQRPSACNDMTAIPKSGDGTCLVFTPAAAGTVTAYVWSTSFLRAWDFDTASGVRVDHTNEPNRNAEDASNGHADNGQLVDGVEGAESLSFNVEAGHTYVLSTTGKTNNMAYAGLEYVVKENVNVPVNAWKTPAGSTYNFENSVFTIIDSDLGTEAGTIDSKTTSVKLLKGHRYVLESQDTGVGATFSGQELIKVDENTSITLELEEIPDVVLSGEFLTSDGGAADVKEISFTNMKSGAVSTGTVSEDGKSYTATLKPGEYTTSVVSDNYVTNDRAHVGVDEENNDLVYLESVNVSWYDLPTEIARSNSNLKFDGCKPNNATSIGAGAGASVTVPVSGVKRVTVAGWYAGTFDINGQGSVTATKEANGSASKPAITSYITDGTETEVKVNVTGEGSNYLYWISVDDVIEGNTITVPGDFDTLKEANNYIKTLKRGDGNGKLSEADRVTIELTADLEEQFVIDQPYVTLKGNGHTVHWYYGVGSFYYSIDDSGLYSDTLFYDRYSSVEGNGSLWGGVAIIRGDNFIAEDTTFKNTYNYEVTEKDAADFEHATGNLVMDRQVGTDVQTFNAKERSNAFYIEAKNIEVVNCKILSSQDTFGRNGSANNGYSVYVKDSVIGGNVDYICGEFNAVFDNCELQWKTYTQDANGNNAKIGYIVAPKTSPYVFRNCEVTADNDIKASAEGDTAASAVVGSYGRTWGAGSNATFYATETNGHINQASAWGQMSGGDTDSTFYEYQNTSNGEPFTALTSTTDKVAPAELPDNLVKAYTTDAIAKKVLGFKPLNYDFNSVLGDVDMDTDITANDAAIAYQIALVSTFGANDPGVDRAAADVDGEEGISANDAAWILQKALVSTTKFPAGEKADDDKDLAETTVYVVGDSTGCDYVDTDKDYYYKRVGFGTRLGEYLSEKATVKNLALSGRSSKSFTTDPEYQTLLSGMKEGDYVLIVFGHNDEKVTEAARGTTPAERDENGNIIGGSVKDVDGTFQNSLYKNYIQPALAAGATPILGTPIVRRDASGKYTGAKVHQTNGGDYSQDIIDLGAELGLTVVDTTKLTKELDLSLTADETADMHAWGAAKAVDDTHLNNYGAAYVAYLIAGAIKASDSTLAPYVGTISAPDKAANLEVNPDWKEPDNSDPAGSALISQLWTTTSPWYGSVFGDFGGQGKLINIETITNEDGTKTTVEHPDQLFVDESTGATNFNIEEKEDGSVNLRAGQPGGSTGLGKIASGSDSFSLYYQPVDASSNFEISGNITVNTILNTNNQVSFGAICLDSIKIDKYVGEAYKYVAAGGLKYTATNKDSGAPEIVATFARGDDQTLANIGTSASVPQPGDKIPVKIIKKGDVFTLTYGDTTTEYTMPMEGTVYVGFYATRLCDVDVTDIVFNNEIVE